MMTAPSEMRKATGMLPCAGGFNGLGAAAESFAPAAFAEDAANPAKNPRRAEEGIAAAIPRAADWPRNSRRFIVMVLSFRCDLRTSQRDHRVDRRHAPRGQKAGCGSDGGQDDRHSQKS